MTPETMDALLLVCGRITACYRKQVPGGYFTDRLVLSRNGLRQRLSLPLFMFLEGQQVIQVRF